MALRPQALTCKLENNTECNDRVLEESYLETCMGKSGSALENTTMAELKNASKVLPMIGTTYQGIFRSHMNELAIVKRVCGNTKCNQVLRSYANKCRDADSLLNNQIYAEENDDLRRAALFGPILDIVANHQCNASSVNKACDLKMERLLKTCAAGHVLSRRCL